ncbi:MAG: NADH-quinone oxidoreductase subunit [Solirubrobacterales bacterium]|jgi:NADH-quinone oxidoreductase subunit G|nr:NADH-quinone oxidoreductase subunit [Solirubrobacterales bacterium]
MTRKIRNAVTLVVDGREVTAPEGTMLVDAAKLGDVEIPVFCYEPKLGDPVGACRMCLVEIEGLPKLQTACSTPVRDGMIVHTRTDQVRQAQNAVVEFLLVNHPLDCPVCDKGGECPLQDISMGWGPERSRVTDPKRHFRKPLELSPLVAIDRERCILCYRCVRFSQEVAEDSQLQLLERGDRSYVGTFDERPYVAPFHGNIIELCPVGALTSYTYRFRARPWDIEDAGSICTLCPSQCNVRYTVRDERLMRVMARDNPAVDDGWLCDKGRFGFQMVNSEERITEPLIREGGGLRKASWAEAIERAAAGLAAAGERAAAIVGPSASNEEGYLVQRIFRQALGSGSIDSRAAAGPSRDQLLALSAPELSAQVADIDSADAILVIGADPLHASPILDLRLRKAVRRTGARLAVVTERPTTLDGGATEAARVAPGEAGAFLAALAGALRADGFDAPGQDHPYGESAASIAALLSEAEDVVILWGERIGHGAGGEAAIAALLACGERLGLRDRICNGLLELPDGTNARGLREVGCLPGAGPGLSEAAAGGLAAAMPGSPGDGATAMLLFEADPLRDGNSAGAWEQALTAADFVVAVSMFENASTARADVVFPAEAGAEKDGTMTHPDGRVQRLRAGVPHPAGVGRGWQWLCELAAALGHETGFGSVPEVLAGLAAEVPFYAGLTHEEIGGRGVRWPERQAASALEQPSAVAPSAPAEPPAPPSGDGLLLGSYRDIWSGAVTEANPALRFLAPEQMLDLAPADAERLGVADGEQVAVGQNGSAVEARVRIRERMRPGAGFLVEGTAENNANLVTGGEPQLVSVESRQPAEAEAAE